MPRASWLVFILIFMRWMHWTVAELLPGLSDCGHLKLSEFEDHSGTVQPNEFPWLAHIVVNETNRIIYQCNAALINQRYLLTFTNCLQHDKSTFIAFATDNNSQQYYMIEEIILHPYLNRQQRLNDIALVRLSENIRYTDSIRPICLPTEDVKNKEFGLEQLIIAGSYVKANQFEIHKLPVVIGNIQDCRRKFEKARFNMTDRHLCGIACHLGNSYKGGSALMDISGEPPANYYLAGLLTAGVRTCIYPGFPDLFVRIDGYLDWIIQNIVE